MTSLAETYLACKAAFAAQLANKGVTASSSEGLTTLISKIADIEQGTCSNGIFLYAGKDICQTSDTIGIGAVAVQSGKLIDDTITVYRSDMVYQNKLTSGTASEWVIQESDCTGFSISSNGATLDSDGKVYLNRSLDIKNDSHIIEFDCKPLSESSTAVFGQIYYQIGGSGYYENFRIGSSGGSLCDDSFSLPSSLEWGDWIHVRLEWTPTEQKIYIDGTLADTTTQDYSGASTYDDLYLTLMGFNGGFIVKNVSVLTNPASVCTGSHGSCTGTYTGAGRGKTEFVARCGSVVSEPFVVWDTLFHDEATSSRSAGWTNGNALSIVTEEGCTKLSSTNSNTTQGTSKITTSVSGDFELDLQANIPIYSSTVGQYIGVTNTNSQQSIIRLTQTGWNDIKFKRVNGAYSCQIKAVDSSTWSSLPLQYDSATTDSVNVVLVIYNPTGTKYELHYKNLKIYSL